MSGGRLTKRGSHDGMDQNRPMGGPGVPMGGSGGPMGGSGGPMDGAQGGQRVFGMNIPSPFELHKTENPWTPGHNMNEDPLADVSRQTLAILNKLTAQTFDKLVQKFEEITIDTEAKLRKCVELIFEKSIRRILIFPQQRKCQSVRKLQGRRGVIMCGRKFQVQVQQQTTPVC